MVLAHLALLQYPQPQEVLLIGGGLGGSLREILRHPVRALDYVELDEGLVALSRGRAPAKTSAALDDPRVRLIHSDGRLFLKHSLQDYDLIIVDLPEPATTELNRFYTVEFFREAAARLGTAGVLVLSLPSTPDLRASAIANRNATIWHSLKLVFPKLLVIGERRLLYFATGTDVALVTDPAVLATRLTDRALHGSDFQPGRLYSLLLEDRLRRVNWILRNHGRSGTAHLEPLSTGPLFPPGISEQAAADHHLPPVYQPYFINRDFRPIAVMHTLMFWSAHARAGQDLECTLCPWLCRLSPGRRGRCRVRQNSNGRGETLVYGKPCLVQLDPVERKPFFHVRPGSRALSVATAGCPLACRFC